MDKPFYVPRWLTASKPYSPGRIRSRQNRGPYSSHFPVEIRSEQHRKFWITCLSLLKREAGASLSPSQFLRL